MAGKVRIGVIGVGQIGKHHLNTYAKIDAAEVVAAADLNAAELGRVAEAHGIRHTYTDPRQLLARDDIEAVDVCLHNNYHRPMTVAALEAGKHVYCEKPMAGAYADALAMYRTAQQLGRKLSIQLATVFAEETKAARYLIDRGLLGTVYHGRSTGHRRRGRPYVDGYGTPQFVQKEVAAGGALYDMGVYHIARMLYLLGNPEVRSISGKTYQETEMDEERRSRSGYSVEELGLGFVKLANHVTLDIIEAWAVNLDRLDGSVVLGSRAGIRLEPFGYFASVGDVDLNAGSDMGAWSWRQHALRENADAYDGPQQHWVAALQGRVPLLPTAELALATMMISEGIYLSDRLGREVTAEQVEQLSVSTAASI